MIKVVRKGNIIEISGHANYAPYGKDIVCASVSSVVTAVVNCIMVLDKDSIGYQDDGNKIIIEKINDNTNTILLLDTMFEMLKDLGNQYKENIKVESEE